MFNHLKKQSTLLMTLAMLLMVLGCRDAANLDAREARDPLLRKARIQRKANDLEGAIELYNKALERKPGMARAHLELGLLYDSPEKEDYVRAVYHYQRYLELRPDAEKRELIEDQIRRARISFAASLPDQPSGAVEEIADLKRENRLLRQKLEEFSQVKNPGAVPVREAETIDEVEALLMAPAAPPVPTPAPMQDAVENYVVQPGDTLSRIAAKRYDDPSQWRKIFEANRSVMKNPANIKVGQVLIIPR